MDATQKLDLQRISVRRLAETTPIEKFRCGNKEIDDWASGRARELNAINRARLFCGCLDDGEAVQGFYALSFEEKDTGRWLSIFRPRHPKMPVIYITYIAILRSAQGQGLGSHLLIDALKRAHIISEHIGFHGVALRSLNDRTTNLYRRFGFAPIDQNANPLMLLPAQALTDLFSQGVGAPMASVAVGGADASADG